MPSVSVYLPADVLEKLGVDTLKLGLSRSQVVVEALGGSLVGVGDRLEDVETRIEKLERMAEI